MELDETALVEQCIQIEKTCNRSLNERDIYVFPMLAILVFILFRRKGQRLKLKALSYSKSYIHLPQCEQ